MFLKVCSSPTNGTRRLTSVDYPSRWLVSAAVSLQALRN